MSDEMPGAPQQEPTPPEPAPSPGPSASDKEERMWAMFAHLSGIIFGFLGPLVIWLIQKDKMPFVNDQGKEALNWQLTLLIAAFAAMILSFIGIGVLLFPIIWIAAIVFGILGGVKANEGTAYRYPFRIELVK